LKHPLNDPIFGAHQSVLSGYIADHELTALACTETFRKCHEYQRTEPRNGTQFNNEDTDLGAFVRYPAVLSVWLNTILRPLYGRSRQYGSLRLFLSTRPDGRRRWQDDVEARFIRSLLRVRHTTKYAAEEDLLTTGPGGTHEECQPNPRPLPQLYKNDDHTNINLIGMIFTTVAYLYILAASVWSVLLVPEIRLYQFIVSTFDRLRRVTLQSLPQVLKVCSFCVVRNKWRTPEITIAVQ
jgi:hypothetical protein